MANIQEVMDMVADISDKYDKVFDKDACRHRTVPWLHIGGVMVWTHSEACFIINFTSFSITGPSFR